MAAKKAPAKKAPAKKAPAKKASPLLAAKTVLGKALKDPKAGSFVDMNEDKLQRSIPHLPTGSIVVDNLIGGRVNRFGVMPCPGFPRSRVVNVYGKESAGKTTLCLTACATICASGGSVCYIDWEHALDLSYVASLGVPIGDESRFMLSQPHSLEEGIKVLWMMAKAGVDLIVVDSVSAGVPEAVMNQALGDKGNAGRVGEVAAIWSRFLPQVKSVISKSQTCLVGISQLRKTINKSGYGPDTTTAGGEAWKYYSELRLMLSRIKTEKGMVYDPRKHMNVQTATCNIVKVKIEKCKVAASQGLEDTLYMKFGEGIDDVRSVIDTAINHGVVKKGGAWYTYEAKDGTAVKGQGMEAFKAELQQAEGVWSELYQSTLLSMTTATAASVVDIVDEDDVDMAELEAILTGNQPLPEEDE